MPAPVIRATLPSRRPAILLVSSAMADLLVLIQHALSVPRVVAIAAHAQRWCIRVCG
jgi:hypothetical protein